MTSTPAFAGSIPENYHRNLGPVLFESYAKDLAARLLALGLPSNAHILETAAGTGIVTQALLKSLPASSQLTATDLSDPMLAFARSLLPQDPRLTLAQADACSLPFADATFDAVFCQYGVMFFPDKIKAMREARRVLKPRAPFIFNVWDSLDNNPIAGAVQRELESLYPNNPPAFLNTPFGWHDRAEIERTVRAGGFTSATITALTVPCVAASADQAARALMLGTPLALDLAERKADVPALLAHMTRLLAERFGDAPCRSTMNAFIIEAR